MKGGDFENNVLLEARDGLLHGLHTRRVASVASVADVADSLFAGLDRRGLGEMFCLDSSTL